MHNAENVMQLTKLSVGVGGGGQWEKSELQENKTVCNVWNL